MGRTEDQTARMTQGAIWISADRYLRSVVEPEDYGDYIIPLTILRRVECLLDDSKPEVLDFLAHTKLSGQMLDMTIQHKFRVHFHNGSLLNEARRASQSMSDG